MGAGAQVGIFFSYFSRKAYVVGTQQKHLAEEFLMVMHNLCCCGEIKSLLSG